MEVLIYRGELVTRQFCQDFSVLAAENTGVSSSNGGRREPLLGHPPIEQGRSIMRHPNRPSVLHQLLPITLDRQTPWERRPPVIHHRDDQHRACQSASKKGASDIRLRRTRLAKQVTVDEFACEVWSGGIRIESEFPWRPQERRTCPQAPTRRRDLGCRAPRSSPTAAGSARSRRTRPDQTSRSRAPALPPTPAIFRINKTQTISGPCG